MQAIGRFGTLRGSWLATAARRCHPSTPAGTTRAPAQNRHDLDADRNARLVNEGRFDGDLRFAGGRIEQIGADWAPAWGKR